MERILVSDIMTREPISVKPSTNLLDCARTMVKKRVGSLLILDKKKLVGFISTKDILWALIKKSKKDLEEIKAVEISPKKIATIGPNATIKEALSKMKKLKFERLPVILNNQLVGMITIKDILTFNPEIYSELDEFAEIREETEKLSRIKKFKDIKEGVCEECGSFEILSMTNGDLLCENCREKI